MGRVHEPVRPLTPEEYETLSGTGRLKTSYIRLRNTMPCRECGKLAVQISYGGGTKGYYTYRGWECTACEETWTDKFDMDGNPYEESQMEEEPEIHFDETIFTKMYVRKTWKALSRTPRNEAERRQLNRLRFRLVFNAIFYCDMPTNLILNLNS